MPKTQGGDDKKHGDTLQDLIDRTGRNPSPRKRQESADDDDALPEDDDDPALLEDDDDENVQNDDVEARRDVGES